MRNLLIGLLCGLVLVFPMTCQKSKTSGAGKKLTIAVIPKSVGNEFWETVHKGAEAAAKQHDVDMRWEGTQSETEIAEQKKIIESMVNLGVKGIALAPLNQKVMAKSIDDAVAAKIPVVVFDSDADSQAKTSFVATDNVKGGEMGAKSLAAMLGDKKGGKIVVLRFIQGTMSTEKRAEGFINTIKAAGHEVIADPYPEGGAVEGSKVVATNTLEKYVKDKKLQVDGIFACNLVATLGMLGALEDLKKSGVEINARFVGFDTSPKLIKALQEGKIDSLVAQNPRKMGFLAVDTLVRHLKGEKVDRFIDTGVDVVTKEKLKDKAIRELVGLE